MIKTATNYNFDKIEFCMGMISKDHSSSILSQLKSELNNFFTKVKCRDILYTNNTDKLFFGMRIYPIIESENIIDVLRDDEPIMFNGYYLELDSKLFDPMLDLTDKELTSILLHEIGHIVNYYLSKKELPFIYEDSTVFVGETASIVNEIRFKNWKLSSSFLLIL